MDDHRRLLSNCSKTIDALDLVDDVAPIQLAIRLLVTAESKLLELPDIRDLVDPFDAAVADVPMAACRSARRRAAARGHADRWRASQAHRAAMRSIAILALATGARGPPRACERCDARRI